MSDTSLLSVRLERHFTVEMEMLRRHGWEQVSAAGARDRFDAGSLHLTVAHDGRPVGMIRVTSGSPSVLHEWSSGKATLPQGDDVTELTRGVVARPFRRLGVYRLAMLDAILRMRPLGARVVTGAVDPHFPGRSFLAEVGFVDVGTPVLFDDYPRSRTLAQGLMLTLDPAREPKWWRMWRAQIDGLHAAGYRVDSDLAPVVTVAGSRS